MINKLIIIPLPTRSVEWRYFIFLSFSFRRLMFDVAQIVLHLLHILIDQWQVRYCLYAAPVARAYCSQSLWNASRTGSVRYVKHLLGENSCITKDKLDWLLTPFSSQFSRQSFDQTLHMSNIRLFIAQKVGYRCNSRNWICNLGGGRPPLKFAGPQLPTLSQFQSIFHFVNALSCSGTEQDIANLKTDY